MKASLIKLIKQNNLVVFLYITTLAGTLLGVVASIINTRFLPPSDYGDVRYVQNIINLFATLLLFGYFWSGSRMLALSKNEERSRKIRGCLILILVLASVVIILLTGTCYFFHQSNPQLAILFITTMPVCIYPLLNNYMNTVAQGDNHIIRLGLARILPYLLYISFAYFIYKHFGVTSKLMILLQWGAYSLVLLLIIISTKPYFRNIKAVFEELQQENRQYGIQLYIGSIIMVATNYIAGITLGIFSENNVNVGFYTLALTVTSPLTMLPAIIGTTYFKKFASQNRISPSVLKATILLTSISCVCFIALIQPLVVFLYTDTYSKVGVYASFMAIGFSLHGIGDMFNRYLGSHGKGRMIRNSSIFCGIFKIIGFTLFVYLWDIYGAIATNILSSTIYALILILYYRKFTKEQESLL